MPRKVLITKDTLEEILAKYQGGGSGGGGSDGVEQEVELFDKIVLNINTNIDEERVEIDNVNRLVYSIKTTNGTDDIRKASQLLSNSSSRLNFVIADLDDAKSTVGSILKWTNYSDNSYNGMFGNNAYVTNIDESSLGKAITDGSNYIEKAWLEFRDSSFYGFRLVMQPYAEKQTEFYNDLSSKISNYTVTLEIVCPKDKITVQGGGTVEAEPIISIKMTNLDARPTDAYEGANIIYTLEFCCTKERWDSFVSLASQQFQIDITYQNFDSVFKQLNANLQGFVLGYLLMDYYENSKKILPNLLVYQTVLDKKIFTPSSFIGTIKNNLTNNIEVVAGMELKSLDGDGSLPNIADRTTVVYTTANTVITVEEIAGATIGSSSGNVDLSNLQVGHLTFSNDQLIGAKSMGSIWSVLSLSFDTQNDSYTFWAKYMCSEEEMYDLFNDKLEQYRQQGLTIPTVTDHDTLTQAFNTIIDTLFALDSSSAALTIAGFITLMFGPSVYGPFQGFMKDSGTNLFSLIRSGDDFGMYIISTQGNMVSVLDTLANDIGTTKPTNISMWIND